MFRTEMPRVYELRDLIADPSHPSAYFQKFDVTLNDPLRRQVWHAREQEFQRLWRLRGRSLEAEGTFLTWRLRGRS